MEENEEWCECYRCYAVNDDCGSLESCPTNDEESTACKYGDDNCPVVKK